MPHLTSDSFDLPFNGSFTVSRHCSAQGAKHGAEKVGRQCLALLTAYREQGPLTDRQAAAVLGVERTTINARRAELMKRRLVRPIDVVKASTGVNNVRWGLE